MPRNSDFIGDNIIDSRDIIARIEELEGLADDATDEEKENVEDELSNAEDELSAWETSEEAEELKVLKAAAAEGEGYGDWEHGETLILESYFVEYVQELVSDIGDMPKDIPSYIVIDWEATADNLKADYTEVTVGDYTYFMRA